MAFFFPAGFTQMWHYRLIVYSLNRKGITVVGFNFAWRKAIKENDFGGLYKLIDIVDETVKQFIETKPEIIEFINIGLSFGSVLSLYTAKNHKKINTLILFAPYGTLSHLFWTYKPAKPFIQTLARKGINNEKDLEKLTAPVETLNKIFKLSNRKIISFRGMSDDIVLDGEKIESALADHCKDSKLFRLPYGHFFTCVVGLSQRRKWLKYL